MWHSLTQAHTQSNTAIASIVDAPTETCWVTKTPRPIYLLHGQITEKQVIFLWAIYWALHRDSPLGRLAMAPEYFMSTALLQTLYLFNLSHFWFWPQEETIPLLSCLILSCSHFPPHSSLSNLLTSTNVSKTYSHSLHWLPSSTSTTLGKGEFLTLIQSV